MRIGVIGSGSMGGSLGRLLGLAGYDVMFSGASDPARLSGFAEQVRGLITDIGFEPVDSGPLRSARYLEPARQVR